MEPCKLTEKELLQWTAYQARGGELAARVAEKNAKKALYQMDIAAMESAIVRDGEALDAERRPFIADIFEKHSVDLGQSGVGVDMKTGEIVVQPAIPAIPKKREGTKE